MMAFGGCALGGSGEGWIWGGEARQGDWIGRSGWDVRGGIGIVLMMSSGCFIVWGLLVPRCEDKEVAFWC